MNSLSVLLLWANLDVVIMLETQGHNSYLMREKATEYLKTHDARALPYLELGANHPDPEIAMRCKKLIENYIENYLGRILPSNNYGKLPWISSVPDSYDKDKIVREYLGFGGVLATDEDWTNYRRATRAFIRDLYLKKGVSKKEIVKLLDIMVENDIKWCVQEKKTHLLPEHIRTTLPMPAQ